MTEVITTKSGLSNSYPPETNERRSLKLNTLTNIFDAFNNNGNAEMLANDFGSDSPSFITFRYMGSKRVRIEIKPDSNRSDFTYGLLKESAANDSRVSSDILTIKQAYWPSGSSANVTISITTNNFGFWVSSKWETSGYKDDDGIVLSGYTAKHMITGDRIMLINDMLPGSDVAVGSTTQGIAIPRPSTLYAPQSDIMYSIPIIIPSGDDAGFTGYFADGKFVFSNIHQYPIGTTVSIEGKRYSIVENNYIAPLED